MAISVDDRVPLTLQQAQTSKDSLKFADIQKTFNIVSEVPSTDAKPTEDSPAYDTQISEILDTLKALQIAKKSLSDVQSITKDIKSNYKTEKNDAWAPIDDTMLRQRYEAAQQIKDILKNATFNNQNVFTMDYSKSGVSLDLQRKDVSALNLRDEQSIDIFSYNIDKLSQQIGDNIQKLQDKIDKIKQSRWLSMENLRNVRIQPKEVNATTQADVPSLASILAQLSQQDATSTSNTKLAQEQKENDENAGALQNVNAENVAPANIEAGNEVANLRATESKTDYKDTNTKEADLTDSNKSQQTQNKAQTLAQNSETQDTKSQNPENPKPQNTESQNLAAANEIKDGNTHKESNQTNTENNANETQLANKNESQLQSSAANSNSSESTLITETKDSKENTTQTNDSKDTKDAKDNTEQKVEQTPENNAQTNNAQASSPQTNKTNTTQTNNENNKVADETPSNKEDIVQNGTTS